MCSKPSRALSLKTKQKKKYKKMPQARLCARCACLTCMKPWSSGPYHVLHVHIILAVATQGGQRIGKGLWQPRIHGLASQFLCFHTGLHCVALSGLAAYLHLPLVLGLKVCSTLPGLRCGFVCLGVIFSLLLVYACVNVSVHVPHS